MKRFFALLCVLCMLCSFAAAEGLPQPQTDYATVSAVGEHAIALKADSACLSFVLSAFDETLAEAETLAAANVDSLKYALMAAGAEATAVSVRRTDAQNVVKYQYNKLQEPVMERVGCSVSYVLEVQVEEISLLPVLVDAAVNNGLYESYEVTLQSSRCAEAYAEALTLAAQTAVEKAQALASAVGLTQTEIESVVELSKPEADPLSAAARVEVTLRQAQ